MSHKIMESHFAQMLAPEAAAISKAAAARAASKVQVVPPSTVTSKQSFSLGSSSKPLLPKGASAFLPARNFQGARSGYKFQRGPQGVGYYWDGPLPAAEDASEPQPEDTKKRKREEGERLTAANIEDLNEETIAKLLEQAEQNEIAPLDATGLRQMLLSLEKKINRNQRLRMKFPDDPTKFMASEVDLDEELQSLQALSAAPELYPILVSLDAVTSLLGLLTHENTDISISTIALLAELTDAEVLSENAEAVCLVEALVENQGLELLMQNLSRLDDNSEDDSAGIYNTMQILENMIEMQPSIALIVCERTNILRFLIRKIKGRHFDTNKLFATELLSNLLLAGTENQVKLGSLQGIDGIDTLLQAISYYKRRNASSKEEEECIENLFDCLSTALLIPENQAKFRQSEGFELMLRCLREGRGAAPAALRTLSFALQNCPPNAERLVEAGGLKLVFPVFMGRGFPHKQKGRQKVVKRSREERQTAEQTAIAIVAALCSQVTESSPGDSLMRLLNKFVEGDFSKVERVVELYLKYHQLVAQHEINASSTVHPDSDSEDEEDVKVAKRYLRKLDAGLSSLQLISVVLAFIASHTAEGSQHAQMKLHQMGRSISELHPILTEYIDGLGSKDESLLEEVENQKAKIADWLDYL